MNEKLSLATTSLLWFAGSVTCFLPYITIFFHMPFVWHDVNAPFHLHLYVAMQPSEIIVAHTIGLLISGFCLSVYIYLTRNIAKKISRTILKGTFIFPYVLMALTVFLISNVLNYPIHGIFASITVGSLYIVGFFGLYSMYQSLRYKDKQKRWLILFMGFMTVLIAFFSLETLFKEMGRM